MKKLLLTLGSIAAVAAPVASVVACGAPAPIKLDKSKIEGMRADVKAGLVTALHMSDADTKTFDEGTVTEDKGLFVITYKDTTSTDNIVVVVNADAEIQSAVATMTTGGDQHVQQITSEQLKAVQQTMTEATHETIRTKQDFDINDYDADVIAAAGSALVVPQDASANPSNDEIKTFNDQVDAFQPAFQQAVADQTAAYFNGLSKFTVTKDAFTAVDTHNNDETLTLSLMNKLGIEQAAIDQINKYIADGAELKIRTQAGDPNITGYVQVNGKIKDLKLDVSTASFSA